MALVELGISSRLALRTMDAWRRATTVERRAVGEDLAAALGPSFLRFEPATGELASVMHEPSGVVFLAIPGGHLMMGVSVSELEEMKGLADEREAEVTNVANLSRPVHAVEVAPFLFAATHVDGSHADRLLPRSSRTSRELTWDSERAIVTAAEAATIASAAGLRLPSEAEWEYVAREAGERRWVADLPADMPFSAGPSEDDCVRENLLGVAHLVSEQGEFVADAWHDSYGGAPATSIAWDPEALPGVMRGGHCEWQDPLEALSLLAASRRPARGECGGVRLAFTL